MNEQVIELTTEEAIEDLEMTKWKQGIELFKVTESFKTKGKSIYLVHNLKAELENGSITCSDDDDIILDNRHVLMSFNDNDVCGIRKTFISRVFSEIDFPDGYIIIEKAC